LAVVSWREFARYLTICMEDRPVSYQLFREIFIARDASVSSIYRTIKSFIWQRRLRSNVAMVFMTATMVFILAFPTLTSAMSGYDSNVASRVQDGENNLVPFSNYSRVLYVVHDGWRIGQDGNYWIEEISGGSMFLSIPVRVALAASATDQNCADDPVLRSDEYCQFSAPWSTDVAMCDLVADVSQCKTVRDLYCLYLLSSHRCQGLWTWRSPKRAISVQGYSTQCTRPQHLRVQKRSRKPRRAILARTTRHKLGPKQPDIRPRLHETLREMSEHRGKVAVRTPSIP
jgi:hypothetical protein